jgi:hypothetical protein
MPKLLNATIVAKLESQEVMAMEHKPNNQNNDAPPAPDACFAAARFHGRNVPFKATAKFEQ